MTADCIYRCHSWEQHSRIQGKVVAAGRKIMQCGMKDKIDRTDKIELVWARNPEEKSHHLIQILLKSSEHLANFVRSAQVSYSIRNGIVILEF